MIEQLSLFGIEKRWQGRRERWVTTTSARFVRRLSSIRRINFTVSAACPLSRQWSLRGEQEAIAIAPKNEARISRCGLMVAHCRCNASTRISTVPKAGRPPARLAQERDWRRDTAAWGSAMVSRPRLSCRCFEQW
jgi:hypothetical protein